MKEIDGHGNILVYTFIVECDGDRFEKDFVDYVEGINWRNNICQECREYITVGGEPCRPEDIKCDWISNWIPEEDWNRN